MIGPSPTDKKVKETMFHSLYSNYCSTRRCVFASIFFVAATCCGWHSGRAWSEDKTIAKPDSATTEIKTARPFAIPSDLKGSAVRSLIEKGDAKIPLVVVRGTPYEMGYHLGQATKDEIQRFVPPAIEAIAKQLGTDLPTLVEVWSRSSAYTDDRVEQELTGLSDGSGVPLQILQAVHAVPLLMPYSCSSIAAWGKATQDGHLYQTRNLDWSMEVGAHEFPVVVVYIPNQGIPHVNPTFAGMSGAHTGMNAQGIALAEMGDASAKEAPYRVHAPHFTTFFRTMLYDADSLKSTVDLFRLQPPTKRYHYVFGDGKHERRAVKIRAHSPEPNDRWLSIWNDNDPNDEFAPNVLSCVVYNDEGRGAFPTLKQDFGKMDGESLVALANRIPIKGGNVENVVYDATDLRMWISYAKGDKEAFQRPYAYIDLKTIPGFVPTSK